MRRFRLGSVELVFLVVWFGMLAEQEAVRVLSFWLADSVLQPNPIYSGIGFVCALIGGGILTARNLKALRIGPVEIRLRKDDGEADE
jgi:hypothetical protein